MKVAFIKYVYDVIGPWTTIKWKDPLNLLNFWPNKAVMWQATCLLEADWYIISESKSKGDYLKVILKNKKWKNIINKYTQNVVCLEDVPLDNYDVIITLDPILQCPKNSSTLFMYYVNEHWDNLYKKSLKQPLNNYDLFLDHMLTSTFKLKQLPQAISFPYLYFPELMRKIFTNNKEEKVFVSRRMINTLTQESVIIDKAKKTLERLEDILGIPVISTIDFFEKPFGISEPPAWGDTRNFYQRLSECKYYIEVGDIAGPGQGLLEAASIGCICIGINNRPYHKILCHPKLLCSSLWDLYDIFKNVKSSLELQNEALSYQDKMLKEFFLDRSLNIIKEAIELKKNDNYFFYTKTI
jgi:hypothetical protein